MCVCVCVCAFVTCDYACLVSCVCVTDVCVFVHVCVCVCLFVSSRATKFYVTMCTSYMHASPYVCAELRWSPRVVTQVSWVSRTHFVPVGFKSPAPFLHRGKQPCV